MLESILANFREDFNSLKEEIPKVIEGYKFGKYLVRDIKQRSEKIRHGISKRQDDFALLLQIGEYQFAFEEISNGVENPYSLGVVMYGVLHRKDDKMIDDFWSHLQKINENPSIRSF